MNNSFDYINEQNDAIEGVKNIDKEIQKEFSKGSMANKEKITKMRFEQMLRGLYITQNPLNIN